MPLEEVASGTEWPRNVRRLRPFSLAITLKGGASTAASRTRLTDSASRGRELPSDIGNIAVGIQTLPAEKAFKNDLRRITGKTDADLFSCQLTDIFDLRSSDQPERRLMIEREK